MRCEIIFLPKRSDFCHSDSKRSEGEESMNFLFSETRKVIYKPKLKRQILDAFLKGWHQDGKTLADLERVSEKLFFFAPRPGGKREAYRIDGRPSGEIIVEQVLKF